MTRQLRARRPGLAGELTAVASHDAVPGRGPRPALRRGRARRPRKRPWLRTPPSPARSRRSPPPPATRSSSRRGSPTCRPRPRCLRRAPSSSGFPARRASWSTTAKAYAYAARSPPPRRASRFFTIGRSEEGRDIVMLAIADEEGIQRPRSAEGGHRRPGRPAPHRSRGRRAAHRERAGRSTTSTRVLHADETGSTEAVLELAYRLAVSEQPMIQRIRENVVVLINPVSNPDGRDKVVEWFYRFLKGKTDSPRCRASRRRTGRSTRSSTSTATRTSRCTRPRGPSHACSTSGTPPSCTTCTRAIALLMTWNGTGPYNPNIDPITFTEFLELSFHEVQTLTALGMPGVCDLELRRGVRAPLPRLGGDEPQLHRARLRDLRQRHRGDAALDHRRRTRPRASGIASLPAPRRRSAGRRATTSTTTQTGALAALDYWPRARRRRCCGTSTRRAATPGARASTSRRTRS